MSTKTTGRAASQARNATRVARTVSTKTNQTSQNKVSAPPVPKIEPSEGLKNLSIANSRGGGGGGGEVSGTTGPSTTPSSTIPPESTGPSDALRQMSVALSPVKRTLKGATAQTSPTYQAPVGAKTAAQFEAELGRSAQKEINSLNKYATEQIKALRPAQEEAVRATQSVSTLTGLGGSSEANIAAGKTSAANEAENKLIRQETATKIQTVLSKVASDAQTLAQSERTNFRLDEASRIANEEAQRTKANENIATLGQSGVSADALAKNDPATYQALSESVGGEELLKAMFTLNRPQETILDKKIQGGKYMIAYKNPLDDKIRIETVDLGLPPEYNNTIDAGDRLLAIPDGWDGDPSKLVTINKGLTPSQALSGDNNNNSGVVVSEAAQNIIDQVNLGVPLDELIKGTSNAAQKLRNEVLAGLNAQGGLTTKSADILAEGKDIVDRMINNNAHKALGGYSTIFGGQYSTSFGDAQAQAGQLQAILARDNLGLLKGAMSDKDLAFIQSMSSGFEGEGTQSEAFIKERLGAIQTKLQTKLSNQKTTTQTGTLKSPDGSQEVNVADLTPTELQEAKNAGWK